MSAKTRINIMMIGESCVGKTSLVKWYNLLIIISYNDDEFPLKHIITLGIDFVLKEFVKPNNEIVYAKIWDTGGQERFLTITKSFYQRADGILLVFDLTNETTFHKVSSWINAIEESASPNVIKFLVGNKVDLTELRVVETEDAKRLSESFQMKYYETSARNKSGVCEVFHDIIEEVCDHFVKKNLAGEVLKSESHSKTHCC